jgi:D-tyrosyl-tRNA(Tyr) deacylase
MDGDADEQAEFLARKVAKLRIFEDEQGKMNKSILDVGGSALVVSQFTLAADTSRGNRPGFSRAAHPEEGNRLYKLFNGRLTEHGIIVETGTFGADMKVRLVNDGPVTIWLDRGHHHVGMSVWLRACRSRGGGYVGLRGRWCPRR